MTPAPTARSFEVRHVQLARAAFAALVAIMITFSSDHSAEVGFAVFSGFAIATALVFFVAAWLVYPSGARWPAVLLGVLSVVAGMAGGIGALRTVPLFFVVVVAWAITTGVVETVAGARDLRRRAGAPRSQARDALTVGILTLVLGAALLLVPTQYALSYRIEGVDETFTLTGITIGVGVLGGYAAIVAVYLAIAGLSPRRVDGLAATTAAREDGQDGPGAASVPADDPRPSAAADRRDPA